MNYARTVTVVAMLGCTGLWGCASAERSEASGSVSNPIYSAVGMGFVAYPNPYGDSKESPLANAGAVAFGLVVTDQDVERGLARAPSTTVALTVFGSPATRSFLAHVHVGDCSSPGGHYMSASGAEIHLDFTTDDGGSSSVEKEVDFAVVSGKAKSIVIHDSARKDSGGKPVKLGCVGLSFEDQSAKH